MTEKGITLKTRLFKTQILDAPPMLPVSAPHFGCLLRRQSTGNFLGALLTAALFFTLLLPPLSEAQAAGSFPLKLSSNGRYLVDASGAPFLIHGDSGWSFIVQLTKADADIYLEDRRQKGFNSVIANLIESFYSSNPPKNVYGDGPFTTPGNFATPNEAYFAHVDWVLAKAAEKGIVVLLNPAYLGCGTGDITNTDGWVVEIINNGPTKCRNYGRYLGNRYKNYNNIVWVAGGDRPPSATAEPSAIEILKGIKDFAPSHLWTAQWNSNMNSMDVAAFRPYMDLNGIYAYDGESGYVHQRSLPEYNRPDFKPIFLWESWYEGLNWKEFVTPRATLRRQAYEADLSGSTGGHFGSSFIFAFGARNGTSAGPYNWRDYLSSPGALDMGLLRQLLASRPWQLFEPDQKHTAVTAGYGTFGQSDYVTAARTSDGRLVMAYVPSTGTGERSLTADLSKLSGAVTAQWYNPTSGIYSTISGSPFANSGNHTFATPGNNGTGTNDWVLVLSAAQPAGNPTRPTAPKGLRIQ